MGQIATLLTVSSALHYHKWIVSQSLSENLKLICVIPYLQNVTVNGVSIGVGTIYSDSVCQQFS